MLSYDQVFTTIQAAVAVAENATVCFEVRSNTSTSPSLLSQLNDKLSRNSRRDLFGKFADLYLLAYRC